jgi:hypothetical protein
MKLQQTGFASDRAPRILEETELWLHQRQGARWYKRMHTYLSPVGLQDIVLSVLGSLTRSYCSQNHAHQALCLSMRCICPWAPHMLTRSVASGIDWDLGDGKAAVSFHDSAGDMIRVPK